VTQLIGVAGHDGLPDAPRTQDDVGVDHVGSVGCREKPADTGRVDAVERDDVGCRLADEASESGLAGGIADGLRERGSGNRDPYGR
jgi:hypothetical protein